MIKVLGVTAILSLIVGTYALIVWLFQVVWNLVIPHVFGLTELTFWYSAGIVFLLGFIGRVVGK